LYSRLGESDSNWNSNAAEGLDLALELYPNLPQLTTVLWDLGASHAETSEAFTDDFVESILVSSSKHRFLVLAISNAMRDSVDTALNYIRFARDAAEDETYFRLANIAIWQSNVGKPKQQESLLNLLQAVSDAEKTVSSDGNLSKPGAQLVIATAHLQIALNQLGQAKASIEAARDVVGSTASLQYAESRLRLSLAGPQ
ncbi:MAG: hypothetical protein AAGG44_18320, partial [Planctomycetota bacterium]